MRWLSRLPKAEPEALIQAFRVRADQLELPLPRRALSAHARAHRAHAPQRDRRSSSACSGRPRWGLVPHWAKDPAVGHKLFNARAETLAREAELSRRLRAPPLPRPGERLLRVEARQRRQEAKSQRFAFGSASDGLLLALAGLWSVWRSPTGEKLGTYTIDHRARQSRWWRRIHDRMPVVLSPEAVELGCRRIRPSTQLAPLARRLPRSLLSAEPG